MCSSCCSQAHLATDTAQVIISIAMNGRRSTWWSHGLSPDVCTIALMWTPLGRGYARRGDATVSLPVQTLLRLSTSRPDSDGLVVFVGPPTGLPAAFYGLDACLDEG